MCDQLKLTNAPAQINQLNRPDCYSLVLFNQKKMLKGSKTTHTHTHRHRRRFHQIIGVCDDNRSFHFFLFLFSAAIDSIFD